MKNSFDIIELNEDSSFLYIITRRPVGYLPSAISNDNGSSGLHGLNKPDFFVVDSIIGNYINQRFNDLQKSEETYVFKRYRSNGKGGEFTTDGDKLFINYNTKYNEEQGAGFMSNLRHETEHAVQFEYGELGFDVSVSPHGTWEQSAINFDLDDEYKAREFGYSSSTIGSNPDRNVKYSWLYAINPSTGEKYSKEEKINFLQKEKGYSNLSRTPVNNPNTEKIKNNTQYILPYRERNYGKSYNNSLLFDHKQFHVLTDSIIIGDTIKCDEIGMLPNTFKVFKRHNEILSYSIYGNKWIRNKKKHCFEIVIDSVKVNENFEYVKIGHNKYLEIIHKPDEHNLKINVVRFKKKKDNAWLKENNEKWFQVDYELIRIIVKDNVYQE